MCDSFRGDLQRRPFHPTDVGTLIAAFPRLRPSLIRSVVRAMTDSLSPQIAGVVAILDTIDRFIQREMHTANNCGALLLFSAVGRGNTFTRYQSPEMALVHDALTTFTMAERNVKLLNHTLDPYGMKVTMLHCCGIAVVDVEMAHAFQESAFARDFNARRSLANAFGEVQGPDDAIECIDDVPEATDLSPEQRNAYLRMAPIVASLARTNPFAHLVATAIA